MENLKKNPLSLQLNVEDFAPASNDEKKSLVVMRGKVVISSTRTYRTDFRIVQQGCLIHGTGVIVQAPGDGQIHGEIDLRNAEGGQVTGDGGKLIQPLVKQLMAAPVALQGGEHLVIHVFFSDFFPQYIPPSKIIKH